LNRAVGALEFKWFQTRQRYQADGSAGKRREAVWEFLRVVGEAFDARAVDPIQRGLLVNQVAHLLRMDRGEVDRVMRRSQGRSTVPPGQGAPTEPASPRRLPPDAEQAAWTNFLEVVLNEPGLLAGRGDLPDVARIADQRDRRIGAAVLEKYQSVGEFRRDDVLACFHEPADVERVLELARRGADRGNYERTWELALARLGRAVNAGLGPGAADAPPELASGTEPGQALAGVAEQLRNHRGYAPRRLIRRAIGTMGT
jgi:hypothetical protein